MAIVDLHLHTSASDGRLSPTELVHFVAHRGISIASITDHDSTEGLAEAFEASATFPHLTIIPGIELNTDVPGGEIHILGYFVPMEDQKFQRTLVELRSGRVVRAKGMVEKLAQMGLDIEWDRVLELASDGAVGRPHVAQAMVPGHRRRAATQFRNPRGSLVRHRRAARYAVSLVSRAPGRCVYSAARTGRPPRLPGRGRGLGGIQDRFADETVGRSCRSPRIRLTNWQNCPFVLR